MKKCTILLATLLMTSAALTSCGKTLTYKTPDEIDYDYINIPVLSDNDVDQKLFEISMHDIIEQEFCKIENITLKNHKLSGLFDEEIALDEDNCFFDNGDTPVVGEMSISGEKCNIMLDEIQYEDETEIEVEFYIVAKGDDPDNYVANVFFELEKQD